MSVFEIALCVANAPQHVLCFRPEDEGIRQETVALIRAAETRFRSRKHETFLELKPDPKPQPILHLPISRPK